MCVYVWPASIIWKKLFGKRTLTQNKFQNLFEWHYVHNIHRRAKGHDFCTKFIAIKICNAIIVLIPRYSILFQRNQNVPFSTLQNTQYQKKLACKKKKKKKKKASLSIHSGLLTHSCTLKCMAFIMNRDTDNGKENKTKNKSCTTE